MIPGELQTAIDRETASLDGKRLSQAAHELSDQYQRGDFRTPVLPTAAHIGAYLRTRMPATFAAVHAVFREVAERVPDMRVRTLLDLGAGPGTAMWAALQVFSEVSEIMLVERDQELIKTGRRLAASNPHPAATRAVWTHADAGALALPPHDLVVLSYLLNELSPVAAGKLVAAAWTTARKALVIVEPGTPRTFEAVLSARTALINQGARIVAPCPHHNPCPLAAADDWCHFAVRLERTSTHRRLKGGELGYEDEKFSYIAASRVPGTCPQARIVRHPLFRPGHAKLTLCTADGLKQQIVGKKQKDRYREARKAEWGGSWNLQS